MTDPQEKDQQEKQSNDERNQQETSDDANTNWDEHQQIDEEGNEVGPEDIK